jgi:Zn-dependent metalloprotease
MSKPWPRWPLLLAGVLSAGPSLASEKLTPVAQPTLAQLQSQESVRVSQSLASLKAQSLKLGLSSQDDFALAGVKTDRFGQTHARFNQLYRGVPVWGAQAITHRAASGQELAVSADGLRKGIRMGVTPTLSNSAALSRVTKELAPKGKYSVEPTVKLVVYPLTQRTNRFPEKPVKKQNAVDFVEEVVGYKLAYHVHTELENKQDGVKHTDFIVDAHTGGVLKQWDSLHTAAAKGTGRSQYSGVVPLDVWQNAEGLYEMRDTTRAGGEGLRTYDVAFADVQNGAPADLVLYTDPDNVWGDGQNFNVLDFDTLNDNGQTAAVDAHYGLLATWDYYKKIHARNGIDDKGTPTYNRVHVSLLYDNAFWSDSCFCMSYGDGSFPFVAGGFKSLGVLDVTGHEMSHGVMNQTANLIYAGESGGLNEANSDIFGAMTEFWVRNGRGSTIGNTGGNWLIGEQLSEFPLRVMFKPSLDGVSVDAWYPGLGSIDVHFSSGPMNRAFFFLSQGVQPLVVSADYSSIYLPEGMAGIGNDKAAAIWYRAITTYLYPSANYVAARTASLQSAADLFGASSNEYRAVQSAFAAINVGYTADTYDDRTPPTAVASVSGSAPVLQLSAQTDDNVGVARVEFYVDGELVGERASQPFQMSLDATEQSNGQHQLVVVAFDGAGNSARSEPVSFTVTNTFAQLLQDPGFERGGEGWEADPRGNINFPVSRGAHRGRGYVWLNGFGEVHIDNLYQDVTIPASATKAALTFYLDISTEETAATANDTFVVQARSTSGEVLATLATWSNLTPSLGWVQRSIDLSAYAGQTVRIYMEGRENATLATNFRLDTFSLRVTQGADTEAPIVRASVIEAGSQVGFTADVSDNGFVGAVEFLLDGTAVPSTAGTFSAVVNRSTLSGGLHTLVVRAVDAGNNTGESAPVTFYVDPTTGNLVLNPGFEDGSEAGIALWPVTSDVEEAAMIFAGPDFAAFAHTGTGFFLFWTNMGLGTSAVRQSVAIPADATSAVFSFWLRIYGAAFTDGQPHHTLTVKVRDSSGADLATLKSFSNADDTNAEYVQHRFDLSAYRGQTVELSFEADQSAPRQSEGEETQFFLDDVAVNTSTLADTLAPTLTAGVVGSYGTIQLQANVSDNVWVANLEFLVDDQPVTTRTGAFGSYSVPFNTAELTNGAHQYKVRATDTSGNVKEATVDFEVKNPTTEDVAAPSVSASVEGAYETLTLRAVATDDTGVTSVEFYVDGALKGQTHSAPYELPLFPIPLALGEHTLEVVAYDAYGNSSKATTTFTLEPVTVEIATPAVIVAVGESVSLSASVDNAVNTAVSWSVTEGRVCGTVTSTGLYTAPAAPGICHVVATSAVVSSARATATVKVYTGDINGDHFVDGEDMGLLAQDFGSGGSEQTDLDGSGSVDDSDISLFVSQFGR